MKLNFKRLGILIASGMITGFVLNFFNPSGIPLLREKVQLEWATDSLLNVNNYQGKNTTSDTLSSSSNSKSIVKDSTSQKKIVQDSNQKTEAKQNSIVGSTEKNESKSESLTEPKAITLNQAYSLYIEKHLFIDARESADYEAGHITGSINIPFYQFEEHKYKIENVNQDETIVTYCSGTDCDLSILLGNQLFEMGYKKVFIFFGGWPEWIDAKYPVTLKNEESQEL